MAIELVQQVVSISKDSFVSEQTTGSYNAQSKLVNTFVAPSHLGIAFKKLKSSQKYAWGIYP